MSAFLGIDTSNYTTSCAVFITDDNSVVSLKKLLPVKEGERGIRQSDAVFHHTRQLPDLIEELRSQCSLKIDAVCVSETPREQKGSYMPCFTVGHSTARAISTMCNVPLYTTSHQQGHIMAALYSANRLDLLSERFLAFHVSGGTTEAVLVTPHQQKLISCDIVAQTLDLNAGQLVDRIGVVMGLKFPCGKELEKLAASYTEPIKTKPVLKGCDCCLSGFENKLCDIYSKTQDKSQTAAYALSMVEATVSKMTSELFSVYGKMPVVYAGGVMSNQIIRRAIESKFDCDFAAPEFSCDNAAGVAVIGALKHRDSIV